MDDPAAHLLSQVVGFTHRGALAAGVVPPRDAAWLDRVVLQPLAADPGRGIRVLAVERSTDVANLGCGHANDSSSPACSLLQTCAQTCLAAAASVAQYVVL